MNEQHGQVLEVVDRRRYKAALNGRSGTLTWIHVHEVLTSRNEKRVASPFSRYTCSYVTGITPDPAYAIVL
jgi:hypothetical protein